MVIPLPNDQAHRSQASEATPLASRPVTSIVLVAGPVRLHDRVGHHDYLAGCALLADLLRQTPGISPIIISDGWPEDETVFARAAAIVFYDGGSGKQVFLQSPARIDHIQKAVDTGVGIAMIHQAVAFPQEWTDRGKAWIGGTYVPGLSHRGHWKTYHQDFPAHPITSGVGSWNIKDGWLNHIQFVKDMRGITPLLWSGKRYKGSRKGGNDDIVAWVYERPEGGRSFSFTGLDAHSAWSVSGLRQFMVNGILWTAGCGVPAMGAPSETDRAKLTSYLTPRKPRTTVFRVLRKLAARSFGRRKW